MKVTTYTDFKENLAEFMDIIQSDNSFLIITRKNSKPTILMSLEEFNSNKETLHLLSSPKNAERLRRSIAEARK